MEGSLRVPFVMRWPGHVPAGKTSNEIVHAVDVYSTIASIAGGKIPSDRIIDGVDQTAFLTGKKETSNRDAFPIYLFGQLAAVKYKNWKLHLFWKPRPDSPPEIVRKLFNLRSDPKEEYDVFWQQDDVNKTLDAYMADFAKTLRAEPPVPAGAPDSYRPAAAKKK
jgi:arylsulfatase